MHIELAPQVLLRSNSVARELGRSEELPLTLRARSHRRDFALVPDDDEAAISLPGRKADGGKTQMRFKLLRDCAEFCSVWEGIAELAVSALQEPAHGGHQDTDAMR